MRVRERSLSCEYRRARPTCVAVALQLLAEETTSICLHGHSVVVGLDLRDGELLAMELGICDGRVAYDGLVVRWHWLTTRSARVKLIMSCSLSPHVDRSDLLLTGGAGAGCVAVVVGLHDVDVLWFRMQAALFVRRVLCERRLRCELLRPRPRSGRSDAGQLRLDARSPRAVRALLQHSTLEFGK
jgi:hypothetical protein